MKKGVFVFILLFVFTASVLISCAPKEQTIFQLLDINIDQVDRVELVNGDTFQKTEITNQADINKIVTICDAVKLKFSKKGMASGTQVNIAFYHGEQELGLFAPCEEIAKAKGNTYTITSGSYDLDTLIAMMGE